MKTLCITSIDHPALHAITDLLHQAGLEPPTGLSGRSDIDIHGWHQRVLAKQRDWPAEQAAPNPGRLWEQLAGELFMANLDRPLWGWADPNSAPLLDFWCDFEPQIRFLLVHVPLRDALAQALAQGAQPLDTETLVEQWQRAHQQMLRFQLRHPERSLLVSAASILKRPLDLIDHLVESRQLPLKHPAGEWQATYSAPDEVARYLADRLCEHYPQAQALALELESTQDPLSESDTASVVQEDLSTIIESYRQLCDRSEAFEKTSEAQSKLAQERQGQIGALTQEKAQLTQARDAQAKLAQERQARIDALAKECDSLAGARDGLQTHADQLQQQLTESQEEGELLLLQLHQVQEELEKTFLEQQNSQERIKQLAEEQVKLTAANTASAQRIAELTKAGESQSKLAQERQGQIDALTKEKAQLAQARDAQAKLAEERQARIDALAKERDSLAGARDGLQTHADQLQQQLTESQQEGELLLLQLHQVQEELEHYFLEHQKTKQQIETLERRWQRMLTRHPDYCDYSRLQATPAPDESSTLHWQVEDLETAGRVIGTLGCQTLIKDGVLGFRFSQADGQPLPLLRQPISDTPDGLLLLPIDPRQHPGHSLPPIQQLATSDRRLLHNLARAFHQALAQPQDLGLPKDYPSAALRTALARFSAALDALPPVFSYDRCRLERQQVNPDYEHLWLRLDNPALGAAQWPSLDVRVSCANVGPDRFGTHPKLEFPKPEAESPLSGWYAESQDDFGPKFELRFAPPEDMDIQAWQSLETPDQAFIQALVVRLPQMLTELYAQSGHSIARPCEHWVRLTQDIQRILSMHTAILAFELGLAQAR